MLVKVDNMPHFFENVMVGRIFIYVGEYFLKTAGMKDEFGDCYNSVNLSNGMHYHFDDEDEVQLLNEFNVMKLEKE